MKRTFFSAFAAAAAALALMGAGRESRGSGTRAAHTIYRQRRVAIPRASMPKSTPRGQPRAAFPQKDGTGARISQRAAVTPPMHHAAVVQNAGFTRRMAGLERTEVVPNHYYWHNEGGLRYSHYYDGRNHWYGFYHGPTFYWTRYYGNRWWWFDAALARWVFWDAGFWWWAGPGGVPYVYVDNNYYPYEDSGVTVEHEETQTPPASVPSPNGRGSTTNSPDNRRMVQIFGADAQAFLYDKTASPPVFLKYLGQGVSRVRYTGGTGGAPVQILVEFKDGTFALFDADGNSQSAAVKSAEEQGAPPPAPDSIPPPPSSAPGQ